MKQVTCGLIVLEVLFRLSLRQLRAGLYASNALLWGSRLLASVLLFWYISCGEDDLHDNGYAGLLASS